MNDQADFLKRLVDELSASSIPFMLVGSVAAIQKRMSER